MTQKWDNSTSNVFGNYGSNGQNSSNMQNTSADHIHNSTVMMHSENAFVDPPSSIKENCLRSKECTLSSTLSNCHLPVIERNFSSTQQFMGKEASKDDEEGALQDTAVCFVCSVNILNKNYFPIRCSMNHSHAPLLVLLIDVLGYKLEESNLHTEAVCKTCYHLLDVIDELQQSLTESKTDLRTKFLDSIQRLKLKYPRTDKMLKPRCLRCVQMSHSSSRKKAKGGRVLKGRGADDEGKTIIALPAADVPCPTQQELSAENESLASSQERMDAENGGTATSSETRKSCRVSEALDSFDSSAEIVFDTDPMFFSPDEKLKVGVAKECGEAQIFLCMYCEARYDNQLSLKMHVRVFHMPVLIYDNGQGSTEARYRMGIKLQNTAFNELTSQKPYACLFCPCAYKLQSSLQFHFRENHSPYKPFRCLECKERFRRTIELSRHRLYRCRMRDAPFGAQPKS